MSVIAVSSATFPDVRYPIGRWSKPDVVDADSLAESLHSLEHLPHDLRSAVAALTDPQLDTPYREGGWTVRQLVHHIADSHMNCFLRIRYALTEDAPTIKPYDEKAWAMLADSESAPIAWSVDLLTALHARMQSMLNFLTPAQWHRTWVHPENGVMRLDQVATLYGWHGRHHVAHITSLCAAKGW